MRAFPRCRRQGACRDELGAAPAMRELRASREGALERLDATATVLGLFHEWEGSVVETQIEPGDIVSMYTDGITEARGKNGEEFGEARLLSALRNNHNLEAASLLGKVEQIVEEFRSDEQHDDLTMIIARSR